MKIRYTNKPQDPNPMLKELSIGALFRPINSNTIYLLTGLYGESHLLTDSSKVLWENFRDIQFDFHDKEEFDEGHDYTELLLCVDIESGKAELLHKDITVVIIDAELVVEK